MRVRSPAPPQLTDKGETEVDRRITTTVQLTYQHHFQSI